MMLIVIHFILDSSISFKKSCSNLAMLTYLYLLVHKGEPFFLYIVILSNESIKIDICKENSSIRYLDEFYFKNILLYQVHLIETKSIHYYALSIFHIQKLSL